MKSLTEDEEDDRWMQLAVKCSRQSIPVDSAYCVGAVLVAKNSLKSQLEEELLKRLDNDEIVTSIITGFSRELPGNTHAEQVCLEKLLMKSSTTLESSLSSTPSPPLPLHATLYTTMEPCGERLSGNLPCADRIIRHNQLSSLPSSPSSLLPMIPTASVIMNGTNHSFRFIISRVVIGVKEPDIFIKSTSGTQKLIEAGIKIHHLPHFEEECLVANQHLIPPPQ